MESTGIGEYVRRRRQELGLTQADLADAAGISRARVAQIEGGRVSLPGADHRRRLAQALDVRHIDLVIAAGELTAEEVGIDAPSAGASAPADSLKASLLRAVRAVDWRQPDATAVGRSVLRSIQGVRQDQVRATSEPEAASSGQGR